MVIYKKNVFDEGMLYNLKVIMCYRKRRKSRTPKMLILHFRGGKNEQHWNDSKNNESLIH